MRARPTTLLWYAIFGTYVGALTPACGEVQPSASITAAPGLKAGVSYPSSAAYDSRESVLLVGSYTSGSIHRVSLSGNTPSTSTSVLPLDGREQVLRIRLDARGQHLWVLASNGLYVYDSRTSRLIRRIALDALSQHSNEHCLPDLAIDHFGNAFVSSAMQAILTRIDADTLKVTQHELQLESDQNKDFGFSALAFGGQNDTLYAASATTGALWRVDLAQNRAGKVAISEPVFGACALQAARRDMHGSPSGTDLAFYVAGGFRDGVKRIDLSRTGPPYRVTTLQMAQSVIAPTDFVAVDRKVLIVSSQLSRHPDFNGQGDARVPFTLVPIRQP